ncbi:succinate--CoA ligase subunit alpha [Pseudonocardia sp. C8]|uniref:succinate--CoA ligase subunit alpha n=1 Tax=Pseudonocardia sp. C8 TaxID=2762759 RepID=UPI001642EA22|nr:succinate--CoA ligase subunit alpha [Pseudonocardia sp. C8]MBC3190416.1 succinate--CoA ligase subunit alpha [Pseudonocardia sp. C8]
MSIHIDDETRVIVQGITGRIGAFHTEEMIRYGTNVVAGVTPGKAGEKVLGKRVYHTVKDAVAATKADVSIIFVPPPFAADSIMEAADAGIRYCVCITDGIPVQDMMKVKRFMRRYRAASRMRLTGPNCAGTISPGKCLLGIMPGHIYREGRVGIISRSGTLSYEAAAQLTELGLGVSTSVGIGGDPVNGSSFRDHLGHFEHDSGTDVVLMIGEIGGPQEAEGAQFVRERMRKPVIGYVAGMTAPPGRTMGHAGAIVSSSAESAAEKSRLLSESGIVMAPDPSSLGSTVARVLSEYDPAPPPLPWSAAGYVAEVAG